MSSSDQNDFAAAAGAAADGRFDEAYAAIQIHYQTRRAAGREADRSYKLLHILMMAAETKNGVDRGAAAGESTSG